jgi:hypothetical protein
VKRNWGVEVRYDGKDVEMISEEVMELKWWKPKVYF